MAFHQILGHDFYAKVHADIRTRMAAAGIDLLLLDTNDDVIYTTGFSHYTTERPVVFAITQDGAWLLMPKLEEAHAAHQNIAAEPIVYFEFPGVDNPFEVLGRSFPNLTGTVAYSHAISLARVGQIEAAFSNAKRAIPSNLVQQMRLVKYPEEIVLHREASRIADAMVVAGVGLIADAMASGGVLPSEIEIESFVSRHAMNIMHAEHDDLLLVQGLASGLVYSGARSAFPHGMPTGNPVKRGESIILSLGCRVGGRAAESERTLFIGDPSPRQCEHYAVAYEAQRMATAALVAGHTCASADNLALAYIRDSGMEEYLLHRVGHGMGVMFHEPPWVEAGDQTILEPGMITSSEPAIFVPNFAGYRLADTVLITSDGPDSMTHYPRKIEDVVIA
ncbi:Xaa-Pro dipeptidase [Devosia subaequoris]|uniref:Xaa-Pro dipeptidase n=1 Tax=Devosia subaequoris TaxID=395930 RepID=A0A7W6NCU8_9HYPH|nr:Xaa-Pro peptidase family protein [Devosia subaequoris]MBB4053338.1 Xaa-Pro dipeptidase [Devosia subaequoris]MCP1211497.1 Xaa-Pro peptidase family protein [Devosia subaequoris]